MRLFISCPEPKTRLPRIEIIQVQVPCFSYEQEREHGHNTVDRIDDGDVVPLVKNVLPDESRQERRGNHSTQHGGEAVRDTRAGISEFRWETFRRQNRCESMQQPNSKEGDEEL